MRSHYSYSMRPRRFNLPIDYCPLVVSSLQSPLYLEPKARSHSFISPSLRRWWLLYSNFYISCHEYKRHWSNSSSYIAKTIHDTRFDILFLDVKPTRSLIHQSLCLLVSLGRWRKLRIRGWPRYRVAWHEANTVAHLIDRSIGASNNTSRTRLALVSGYAILFLPYPPLPSLSNKKLSESIILYWSARAYHSV